MCGKSGKNTLNELLIGARSGSFLCENYQPNKKGENAFEERLRRLQAVYAGRMLGCCENSRNCSESN